MRAAVGLIVAVLGGWAGAGPAAVAAAWDLAGQAAAEARLFPNRPADPRQDAGRFSPSLALQPELRLESDRGDRRLTVVPFLRLDADDGNRTHADLRELHWYRDGGSWDVLVGLGKVFWGVTESRHLVDVINQTDLVENIDEEDKLGQPMVNLNVLADWGTLGLFVLPGFRERTFPSGGARLRGPVPIADGDAVYDSAAGGRHVDFALRWSQVIGDWDIGLSYFKGTGREPRLVVGRDSGGAAVLVPHYDQIDQAGVDLQLTRGSWLWKLEALLRGGQGDRFGAFVGGFEYTIVDLLGGRAALGLLGEYLRDGRDAGAPPTAADDDVFVGLRLALNDVQGTEVLVGGLVDRNSAATTLSIEGTRRLGENWTVEFEGRAFGGVPASDALSGIREDDHFILRLVRFF